MNEETKCYEAKGQIGETAEIQKVMAMLEKEIGILDENIANLTQKLIPVLISERLSNVDECDERCPRQCKLAEDIQKDIDAISRMNGLIEKLRYRIAL